MFNPRAVMLTSVSMSEKAQIRGHQHMRNMTMRSYTSVRPNQDLNHLPMYLARPVLQLGTPRSWRTFVAAKVWVLHCSIFVALLSACLKG